MKTFKLDHKGDTVITDNQLELVEGIELIVQTLKQVISTNLGEWLGDIEEGVDFHLIRTKNPNYDLVQDTIDTAAQKVADSFSVELETSNYTFTTVGRHLYITFTITLTDESTSVEVTL